MSPSSFSPEMQAAATRTAGVIGKALSEQLAEAVTMPVKISGAEIDPQIGPLPGCLYIVTLPGGETLRYVVALSNTQAMRIAKRLSATRDSWETIRRSWGAMLVHGHAALGGVLGTDPGPQLDEGEVIRDVSTLVPDDGETTLRIRHTLSLLDTRVEVWLLVNEAAAGALVSAYEAANIDLTRQEIPEALRGGFAGPMPFGALHGISVRLSAEIGRVNLELGEAVRCGRGAELSLDQTATEPIKVRVNGAVFAHARLVVVDGEWGVQITELVDATLSAPQPA